MYVHLSRELIYFFPSNTFQIYQYHKAPILYLHNTQQTYLIGRIIIKNILIYETHVMIIKLK